MLATEVSAVLAAKAMMGTIDKKTAVKLKVTRDYYRRFVVDLDEKTNQQLTKIREWYRSPSDSHTVRLMIDDIAKGLESGDLISRFRQYPEVLPVAVSTDSKVKVEVEE